MTTTTMTAFPIRRTTIGSPRRKPSPTTTMTLTAMVRRTCTEGSTLRRYYHLPPSSLFMCACVVYHIYLSILVLSYTRNSTTATKNLRCIALPITLRILYSTYSGAILTLSSIIVTICSSSSSSRLLQRSFFPNINESQNKIYNLKISNQQTLATASSMHLQCFLYHTSTTTPRFIYLLLHVAGIPNDQDEDDDNDGIPDTQDNDDDNDGK